MAALMLYCRGAFARDVRDLDGVKDVRLTAAPVLALVRLGAEQ